MNKSQQQQLSCCMECTPTLLNLHEQNLKLQQKYQSMKLELIQANINNSDTGASTQMFTTIKKDRFRYIRPHMTRNQIGINQNESRSCNSTKDSIFQQASLMNKQQLHEHNFNSRIVSVERQNNYYHNNDSYHAPKININDMSSQNNNHHNNNHLKETQQTHKISYYNNHNNNNDINNNNNTLIMKNIDNKLINTASLEFESLKEQIHEISPHSKQNSNYEPHSIQKQKQFKNSQWEAFFGFKNLKESSSPINSSSPNVMRQHKKQYNQDENVINKNNFCVIEKENNQNYTNYNTNNISATKSHYSKISNKQGLKTNSSHDFTASPIQIFQTARSGLNIYDRSYTPQQNRNDNQISNRYYINQKHIDNSQNISHRNIKQDKTIKQNNDYSPSNTKAIQKRNSQIQELSQSPLKSGDLTIDNKQNITNRSYINTSTSPRPFPIHNTPILNNLISSNKKYYFLENSYEPKTQRNNQYTDNTENINPNYLNFQASPFIKNEDKLSYEDNKCITQRKFDQINHDQIKRNISYHFHDEKDYYSDKLNQENQKINSNQILYKNDNDQQIQNQQNLENNSNNNSSQNQQFKSQFKEMKQMINHNNNNNYLNNDVNQINNDSYLLQSYKNNDQTGFFNDELISNVQNSQIRSEVISMNKLSDLSGLSFVSNGKSVNSTNSYNQLSNSSQQQSIWYKMVSIVGDRYFSTFDGQTEFIIGVQIKKAFQQLNQGKVKGGTTLHKNLQTALHTKFPQNSSLMNYPKAILKFSTNGPRIKIKDDLYVFQYITPIEAIHLTNQQMN